MQTKRMTVFCVEIQDEPGSLYDLLSGTAAAKVDLRFLTASSLGDGKGRVYVTAKRTEEMEGLLEQSGMRCRISTAFMINDHDRVGAGAKVMAEFAQAGINVTAATALVCGEQYHMVVIVDDRDAEAAQRAIETA